MESSIAMDGGDRGRNGPKPLWLVLPLLFLAACAPVSETRPGLVGAKNAPVGFAGGPDAAKQMADQAAGPAAKAKSGSIAPFAGKGASLIGIAIGDLEAQLGRPARIRVEAPAQIYQYVGAECVLDLYLYAEKTGYRVSYAEARDAKAEVLSLDRCLKSLGSAHIASIETSIAN